MSINTDKLRVLIQKHRLRNDVTDDLSEIVYSLERLLDERVRLREERVRLREALASTIAEIDGCHDGIESRHLILQLSGKLAEFWRLLG